MLMLTVPLSLQDRNSEAQIRTYGFVKLLVMIESMIHSSFRFVMPSAVRCLTALRDRSVGS